DAVAQGLALLRPRQAEHEDREHQRVVRAQQPLEQHEQTDSEEVRSLNVHTAGIRQELWLSASRTEASSAESSSVTGPFLRARRYAIVKMMPMSARDSHLSISKWTRPAELRYSTSSLMPTQAMMMNAPSTMAG